MSCSSEVTDESKELRIMLCKERPRDGSGTKKGTAILAACGKSFGDRNTLLGLYGIL